MDKILLKTIYEKYGREVFLYILYLCGDAAAAEDLTQETFVKALLSLDEAHTNYKAWLYMVARNLTFNHRRKMKRIIPHEEIPEEHREEILLSLLDSERDRLLHEAIGMLDERKREIVTLQYFSELSVVEIAKLTGLGPQNVKVLAYRARKEIKKYMEDHGYEV